MKIILFGIMSLFTINCISQNNNELDRRNGFKSIKIGSTLSSFGNQIRFVNHFTQTNADCYIYDPIDKDLFKIFDLDIQTILLTFKNNNLVGILLRNTYPKRNGDYVVKNGLDLVSNLKIIFGNQTGIINVNNKYENVRTGAYWGSEKLILKCYIEMQNQEDAIDLIISIHDLKYLTNSINSGF